MPQRSLISITGIDHARQEKSTRLDSLELLLHELRVFVLWRVFEELYKVFLSLGQIVQLFVCDANTE